MADIVYRPYQAATLPKIREHFLNGVRGVLLVSPTGSGKTVTFSGVAKGAAERGNEVLILAHRDLLINQASDKLSTYGVHHGIIMSDYTPTPDAMVQVGSVQTMIKRLKKWRYRFKLIIVDEAHLSCARTYLAIIDAFPEARILGVTGSPCRLDGRGLGREQNEKGEEIGGRFDVMVESVTMRELIDDGYAVQPEVYAPLDRIDLSKAPREGADYQKRALSQIMNTQKITGNAIDEWRAHAKHIPSATWCVDIKHATDTAAHFNDAGIKTVVLKGTDKDDVRDRALKQLADGSISNIAFCQLLIEGVDIAELGCIIGLRPTYSLAGYLQTLGRMSRPLYKKGMPQDTREQRFAAMAAGPKGLKGIHLDLAGLTFRHGFQDDIRAWSLAGEPPSARSGASVPLRQCPKCFILFSPSKQICPNGHPFETQHRELKTEEGELGLLTPEMVAAVSESALKKRCRAEVRTAETLEDFQRIGQERNYSPGWALIQFRMREARRAKITQELEARALMQPDLLSAPQEADILLSHPKFNFDKEWDF